MELDNIEKLLAKYVEASTTVAEEETLKAYFAQESVEKHLEQYRPMFQYFFEAKQERFTKEVKLENTTSTPTKRMFNYKWLSVAAVTLLMVGIYFGNEYRVQANEERIATEYAYQETKKALDLLAENFSKGTAKVAYLNQFEKTKQKIYNE